VKAFVVVEMNYGQICYEVERLAAGKCETRFVGHGGGTVHEPEVILDTIMRAAGKR